MRDLSDIAKSMEEIPGSGLFACVTRRDGTAVAFVKGQTLVSDLVNVACVFLQQAIVETEKCGCPVCVTLHAEVELALACIPSDKVQIGHA